MWENLFDHVNIQPENVHIPSGTIARDEIEEHCRGVRADDPGGRRDRLSDPRHRPDRPHRFQRAGLVIALAHAPRHPRRDHAARRRRRISSARTTSRIEAITLGVATILEAREIALIATGEHKAAVIQRAVEGDIDPNIAATYLQHHDATTFYLDGAAAAELTRVKTPWVLGEVEWDRPLEIRALIWLSEVTGKGLLRLDDHDYRENHLNSLLARYGSAGPLNGEVFNTLISRIRGRSKLPSGRKIIVFSPAPRRRRHLGGRDPEQATPERERYHRRLPDVGQHRGLRSRGAAVSGLRAATSRTISIWTASERRRSSTRSRRSWPARSRARSTPRRSRSSSAGSERPRRSRGSRASG